MLGHSDWSPGRKIDPNPYCPWNTFADAQDASSLAALDVSRNFGMYPKKKDLVINTYPDIIIPYKEKGSKSSEEEQVWQVFRRPVGSIYQITILELWGTISTQYFLQKKTKIFGFF